MTTINIINLKGGVGKTISAICIAYILAGVHNKRVLIIDNDKQGSASKFFGAHDYDAPSMADVLTSRDAQTICRAVVRTRYDNLDVLPANMNLLRADKELLLDVSRPQQTRLKKALDNIREAYDYAVIDNAPDLNMSVINALVAADDVMIPIKIDKFSFDGLEMLRDQIADVAEYNPSINVAGLFVTMYTRNNVCAQGELYLAECAGYPLYETVIHRTVKADESTFAGVPLPLYAPESSAAKDYMTLVDEYLNNL